MYYANIYSADDVLDVKVSNGMIMHVKTFRHKTLEERQQNLAGNSIWMVSLARVNR